MAAFSTIDAYPDQDRERIQMAAAHWALFVSQSDVMPYLRYRRWDTCPQLTCKLRDGVILPIGDVWWSENLPPNAEGCSCHFYNVTKRGMRKKQWSETPRSLILAIPSPPDFYAVNWGVQFPQAIPEMMSF